MTVEISSAIYTVKVEVELTVKVDVRNEFGAIGKLEQSSWQERLRKRHLIRGDRTNYSLTSKRLEQTAK